MVQWKALTQVPKRIYLLAIATISIAIPAWASCTTITTTCPDGSTTGANVCCASGQNAGALCGCASWSSSGGYSNCSLSTVCY